jgi:hypothetical protein
MMPTLSLRRCFLPPPSAPFPPRPLFSGDISHPSPVTSFLRPPPCGGCLSAPSALPFTPLLCADLLHSLQEGGGMLWRHAHVSQPEIVAPYVVEAVSHDSLECSKSGAPVVCAVPHLTIPSKNCYTAQFPQQVSRSFGASPSPSPR